MSRSSFDMFSGNRHRFKRTVADGRGLFSPPTTEGLSTIVLDRLGPGGQAGGSSTIENFIGFSNGLSGADLATRSVLQMVKFGATIAAPIEVQRIEPKNSPDGFASLKLDYGVTLHARSPRGVAAVIIEAASKSGQR